MLSFNKELAADKIGILSVDASHAKMGQNPGTSNVEWIEWFHI